MQYVEFIKLPNGDLCIRLLPKGREYIAEAMESGENIYSDTVMQDLFEHQTCNGWAWVPPENIGALTSAPILADDYDLDENGQPVKVKKAYWFPNYQVELPVETLCEKGEVVFTGAETGTE